MADKPSVPRSTGISIGIASILLITSLLLLQRLGVVSDLNLRQADELTELRRQVDDTQQTAKIGLEKLEVACVRQTLLDRSIEDLDSAYRQLLGQLNAKHHLYLISDSLNSGESVVQSDAKLDCLSSDEVVARITRIQTQLRDTKNAPPKLPRDSHSTDGKTRD
jgi:hypothetical protein